MLAIKTSLCRCCVVLLRLMPWSWMVAYSGEVAPARPLTFPLFTTTASAFKTHLRSGERVIVYFSPQRQRSGLQMTQFGWDFVLARRVVQTAQRVCCHVRDPWQVLHMPRKGCGR